jgi:hypothetical protein
MASSTLHAIAVAELRHTNPVFYREYCILIEGITNLIRDLADQHANDLGFTSFTETFDHASNEPVLQIVIGANKNELYLHIYIHKDHYFLIRKSGGGKVARTAGQALEIIAEKLKEVA